MVHIAVERSQQDNRPLPLPAQIATERHSVLAGQHNVQQHQIRFLPRDHLLSAVAARLDHHIHIMLAEIGGDQRAYLRVILNKKRFYSCLLHISKRSNIHRTYFTRHYSFINSVKSAMLP